MGANKFGRRAMLSALLAGAALPAGPLGMVGAKSLSQAVGAEAVPWPCRVTPTACGLRAHVAGNLELITVSDQSVAVSWTTATAHPLGRWRPVEVDTELALAPADSRATPAVVHYDATPTAYHYAEITGLEPGRRYRLEARSAGVRAGAGPAPVRVQDEKPCEFTTLTPPPGRLVRTIALANDVHFGEEISGEILAALPTGVRQERSQGPYPQVMLDALLADVRNQDRNVDHLVLAGDLTSSGLPDESQDLQWRLDSWGTLGRDLLVCRGNHDRPRAGAKWQSGPRLAGTAYHDCWGERFLPRQRLFSYNLAGLRIIGLDTTDLKVSGGSVDPEQMSAFRQLLRDEPDQPTLVFGHHPVTREAARTNLGGPGFVLNGRDAATVQQLYGSAPGVFLHHSGHTHRNRRTRPDMPISAEFLEVAAIKEYPAGYALLRVYEGGYMITFQAARSPAARRWSHRTRSQFLGLQRRYSVGSLADRNHVVCRDLSGIAPADQRSRAR